MNELFLVLYYSLNDGVEISILRLGSANEAREVAYKSNAYKWEIIRGEIVDSGDNEENI